MNIAKDRSERAAEPANASAPARGWGYHVRATLKIGAPLIAAQLTQQAIQVTDTVMLGWLSAEALAAGVLATTLFFVGFIAGTGFAYAVMPLASSAAGADDVRGVRRVVRMGLWVGALVVSVLMIPLW
ncbi:MAG: MATE family efflux transporter, partial [Rhodobacteraceae bacterium]|nr:MATE family efflux transporter [Paracoccaceae bacterium]